MPFAAFLLLALPAPAFAQGQSAAVAHLSDPATQAEVALMAQAMGEILLDMPVAPLIDAADQIAGKPVAPDIDRNARVADVVGPDARRAPAMMAERIPAMMGAMATLAQSFEALAPQMRELARRMPRAAD
jgi:hypothetical protein